MDEKTAEMFNKLQRILEVIFWISLQHTHFPLLWSL